MHDLVGRRIPVPNVEALRWSTAIFFCYPKAVEELRGPPPGHRFNSEISKFHPENKYLLAIWLQVQDVESKRRMAGQGQEAEDS